MEYSLEFFATIGHLMTGVGTITLSILLYRTIKHMAASTRATEIQTEYKFRPWVGPTGIIKEIGKYSDKKRFELTLKNYGEYAATDVVAKNIVALEKTTRDRLKSETKIISLGPMLPSMEKRFWFDIDDHMIAETANSGAKIYIGVLIEYPLAFGKSEYGMISEFDPATSGFVHVDMWVQSPPMRK